MLEQKKLPILEALAAFGIGGIFTAACMAGLAYLMANQSLAQSTAWPMVSAIVCAGSFCSGWLMAFFYHSRGLICGAVQGGLFVLLLLGFGLSEGIGQWRPWIIAALGLARAQGLHLPIVCNTGGYETVESVHAWRGFIDIWLADLKYVSPALSAELSAAPDYFAQARPAIEAMMAQAGHPVFDSEGILQRGVILRHLALPGHVDDSFAVLDQMAAWNKADPGCFLPSVMSQYTPFYQAADHGIGRRITTYEYRRVVNYAMDLGLSSGYMQQKSSAKEEYTPSFDLTGV